MKKVYVGVGHGGKDPGAVGNGFHEDNLTLSISLACQAELNRHGIETKISRTTDVFFPVAMKVPDCNKYAPNLCVEIHINAGGGKGVEVYYYAGGGVSLTLAKNVLANILAETPQKTEHGNGLKPDTNKQFGMVNNIHAPSVLIECFFIDSADVQDGDTLVEQVQFGKAIAHGVLNTLNVPIMSETVEKTYKVKQGDGWWGIATSQLGSGNKMSILAQYNDMTTSTTIRPGQILKIPTL